MSKHTLGPQTGKQVWVDVDRAKLQAVLDAARKANPNFFTRVDAKHVAVPFDLLLELLSALRDFGEEV